MLITLLIPCLNEVKTIAKVVHEAHSEAKKANVQAEILVADNGSTDGTLDLLKRQQIARITHVPIKGYGAALHYGMLSARSKYVLYADADLSYSFTELPKFLPHLKKNYDLVLGSRFRGVITPGAMPWLHQYLGTPLLTFLIKTIYGLPTTDCNSGMRLVRTAFYRKLKMRNAGMEWASELLIKTALLKGTYAEVPISLHKDQRGRLPHLLPWSDGWRHLKAIILLKPLTLAAVAIALVLFALLSYPVSVNIAVLAFFGAVGAILCWLAAELINYSITQNSHSIAPSLLKLPLIQICAAFSLLVVIYTFLSTRNSREISVSALFLVSCMIMLTIWLFFVETIKTHFLNKLPETV